MKTIHLLSCLFALFLTGISRPCFAQDCDGCKDHPLFNRMPNFYIINTSSNFDAFAMKVGEDKEEQVEGEYTHLEYQFDYDSGQSQPSALQVMRNYQNAAKKIGAKVLYQDDYMTTMLLNKNGQDLWISLEVINDGGFYKLDLVAIEAMEQAISANDILDALNKDGFIALYINFDTNKSEIKQESMPVVEQIAQLMKQNPALKLSVEGHTDNTGDAASNKKLSEQRAKAVSDALLAKGAAANRLSFKGWGMEVPIADNRKEEGRALNRRVELVKK